MDPGKPAAFSTTQVLVLGIGNILLRDDGVGIRVLQALEERLDSDARIRFVDGGTIGFMLSALIEEAADLLVIDAVRMSASPGSVRCFENEAMDRFLTGRCGSVHELGLRDVLDMARLTGRFPCRRALVGVEPATTELGEQLSPEVEQGVASAVLMARGVLQRWLEAREPVA
ncbi:MAG TPA: HyaD/HybD family hydrogenase maturation endopeptidase [Steroidobacteraceae bacterium]|nr:HyaD/HybD family hydrogenase maturation endopeptidase [Steroidobacteraceae bacterium]